MVKLRSVEAVSRVQFPLGTPKSPSLFIPKEALTSLCEYI